MPRSGPNGTYTLPGAQATQQPGTPIPSAVNNQGYSDIEQTFNTPQPIAYGGTNATNAADALTNLGAIGFNVDQSAQSRSSADKVFTLKNSLQSWERIGDPTVAVNAPQVGWINLSPYIFLRARWIMTTTGNTGGLIGEASTTNGVSWQSGASDYRMQGRNLINGVETLYAPADRSSIAMGGVVYSTNFASGSIEFSGWNVPNSIGPAEVYSNVQSVSGWSVTQLSHIMLFSGARNAFRIYPIGGTISGTFILEGVRG